MQCSLTIMRPDTVLQPRNLIPRLRICVHKALLLLPFCLCLLGAKLSPLSAQDQIPVAVFDQASEAFEQGKLSEAERDLRSALEDHPRDVHALGMLGVILDAEKQYAEAEKCYDLAVKLEPLSTVLLNNLGNHYLVQGKSESARGVYLRVIGLDSHHENANLHLAEMSVGSRR